MESREQFTRTLVPAWQRLRNAVKDDGSGLRYDASQDDVEELYAALNGLKDAVEEFEIALDADNL